MKTSRLVVSSLLHYWRTNLAVLIGVVAATAVIGGALVVGDSVRESLRRMTLERLGQIDHVLQSHRFFSEDLAGAIAEQPDFDERFAAAAPALVMTGGLEHEVDEDVTRRVGSVDIYGLDERLWKLLEHKDAPVPSGNEVVLGAKTAEDLDVDAGDELTLWIQIPSEIPRDTLLGERDETVTEVALTVSEILPAESGAARLSLNPNQQLPTVAFIALDTLQSAVDLAELPPSRTNPSGSIARVNTIFFQAKQTDDGSGADAPKAAEALTDLTGKSLALKDLGLRIEENTERNYLSLESDQMILEKVVSEAASQAANDTKMATSPVFVYLANRLANADNDEAYSMYSIVAGIESFDQPPPFGPFEFQAPEGGLKDFPDHGTGEPLPIVLNSWLAEDLEAGVGDEINIWYHQVGSHGEMPEEKTTFRVAGIAELEGTVADDPMLTPTVEGVTNARTLREWDQPFEMDFGAVTGRDDEYWNEYKATPKAFLALAAAQELWKSRYGNLTSLRIAPAEGESLKTARSRFAETFLANLDPLELNLAVQPVKYRGLQAASGTTPFAALFIAFSFFLILSAGILISILFRLGVERRVRQIGLLSAVGFSPRDVRRLYFAEGALVVLVGGLIGTAAAVGYAAVMVHGLTTWWYGAIQTRFLVLAPKPLSLAGGFLIAVAMAIFVIWWALRAFRRFSIRELLTGTTQATGAADVQRRSRRAATVAKISGGLAVLLLIPSIAPVLPESEAFSGYSVRTVTFFLVGVLLLVAGLAVLSAWLDSDKSAAVRGSGFSGTSRLGLRNASRNRQRSVLSVALIASATFVIVAVGAGQRDPAREEPDLNSGNGGFRLVAEASSPLLYDLNTAEGRDKLDLRPGGPADEKLLDRVLFMPFRVKPGENASCLNIYQTRLPTILGATEAMIERDGFKFADTPAEHPWQVLTEAQDDGTIPVLGDMNTLMYSLKKGIGDTIAVPNDENPEYTLKIVGMFDSSVFQGVLVMSEENFQTLYPDRVGYQYFLIGDADEDAPLTSEETGHLTELLESGLTPYGFDTERVVDRIAGFLAVQNTYLSTFQTLGGLGLIVGTIGLATVMLRNILERRGELALLRAVGFHNASLVVLVLAETALLLVWGLFTGAASALLAMTPHLLSVGADVPWKSLGAILAGVFVVGLVSAGLAVVQAVKTPIVATLRNE